MTYEQRLLEDSFTWLYITKCLVSFSSHVFSLTLPPYIYYTVIFGPLTLWFDLVITDHSCAIVCWHCIGFTDDILAICVCFYGFHGSTVMEVKRALAENTQQKIQMTWLNGQALQRWSQSASLTLITPILTAWTTIFNMFSLITYKSLKKLQEGLFFYFLQCAVFRQR
jgi:hypothetical protein